MQGRSLAASAAEGGSFAVVKRVVDVMGGEVGKRPRRDSSAFEYERWVSAIAVIPLLSNTLRPIVLYTADPMYISSPPSFP